MKQLTGIDASFLYMESPTTFCHVSGLGIYQRPSDSFDPYQVVYDRFAAVVGHVEPLRRVIAEVPFRLDHPYWVVAEDFDLDFHVRHLGLAPPGNIEQLTEQVARIVGRPLDRSRPLWEVYVIEGLSDGRWALLSKLHHATIDGAAGVILLGMLTDTEPDAVFDLAPATWDSEPTPHPAQLLRRTLGSLVANPVKGVRLNLRLAQNVADTLGITNVSGAVERARSTVRSLVGADASRPANERSVSLPVSQAPSTPWNRRITAHRRFATRSVPLASVKMLKDAVGGTVNDVVMAVCTGALREYLIGHDALPDKPLRAMVPVSIRTGDETDPWTNRVSGIVADLPTHEADPLRRIELCRDAMAKAKRLFELVPAHALTDVAQTASPLVATAAARLASRLADRVNMPANVVISNVPGPRQPLYLGGAQMDNYIPVSIVTDNMGLNITVHSYLDRLDFGLIACRELVPDLWALVDLHVAELERLMAAAGVSGGGPTAPSPEKPPRRSPPPRHRPSRPQPADLVP
jgi:diacylglycerol O-acyltransferase / wax synthase